MKTYKNVLAKAIASPCTGFVLLVLTILAIILLGCLNAAADTWPKSAQLYSNLTICVFAGFSFICLLVSVLGFLLLKMKDLMATYVATALFCFSASTFLNSEVFFGFFSGDTLTFLVKAAPFFGLLFLSVVVLCSVMMAIHTLGNE